MKKECVMVTGASRGIGRAVAFRFAREGYPIVITCSKSREELEQTKEELGKCSANVSVLSFLADAGDYERMKAVVRETEEKFGSVDVLINNAGIAKIGLFQDIAYEEYGRMIQVNLMSVLNCCHLVIPGMIRKKAGKIINISSVWGNVGASCEAVYSAAKGGVNSFTKALGKELAPSNIQVNAVACGVFDTQMNDCLSGEEREALAESIPAGRFGKAEEAAELIFQLAAGHSYLNGQVITLDGAWV